MGKKPSLICKPCRDVAAARKLRRAALGVLGNQCARCGFLDLRALQIDHVNGGGSSERRKLGVSTVYRKVRDSNGEGYQILCANCQWIKRDEEGERQATLCCDIESIDGTNGVEYRGYEKNPIESHSH